MIEVLKCSNLSKRFKSFEAVSQLSFSIVKGEVVGILGPNGSGKTTTLRLILSLIKPTAGNILLFESNNLLQGRQRIGVSLDLSGFLPGLNAYKNLKMAAIVKNVPFSDIDRVIEIVDLGEFYNKKYSAYSYGMRQKLSIASALLGDPEMLIFDEPTNGLDPYGIKDIRNIINKLSIQGKTIIIASHLLVEIESLCTGIVILNKGLIVKFSKMEEIIDEYGDLESAFMKLLSK